MHLARISTILVHATLAALVLGNVLGQKSSRPSSELENDTPVSVQPVESTTNSGPNSQDNGNGAKDESSTTSAFRFPWDWFGDSDPNSPPFRDWRPGRDRAVEGARKTAQKYRERYGPNAPWRNNRNSERRRDSGSGDAPSPVLPIDRSGAVGSDVAAQHSVGHGDPSGQRGDGYGGGNPGHHGNGVPGVGTAGDQGVLPSSGGGQGVQSGGQWDDAGYTAGDHDGVAGGVSPGGSLNDPVPGVLPAGAIPSSGGAAQGGSNRGVHGDHGNDAVGHDGAVEGKNYHAAAGYGQPGQTQVGHSEGQAHNDHGNDGHEGSTGPYGGHGHTAHLDSGHRESRHTDANRWDPCRGDSLTEGDRAYRKLCYKKRKLDNKYNSKLERNREKDDGHYHRKRQYTDPERQQSGIQDGDEADRYPTYPPTIYDIDELGVPPVPDLQSAFEQHDWQAKLAAAEAKASFWRAEAAAWSREYLDIVATRIAIPA